MIIQPGKDIDAMCMPATENSAQSQTAIVQSVALALIGWVYIFSYPLHMQTQFPSCLVLIQAVAAHTNAEHPCVMAVQNKSVQENHAYSTYLVCLEHRQVENGCKGACESLQHSRPVAHVLLVLQGLVCPLKGAPSGPACQGCTLPQELITPLASLHQACIHSFIHSCIHSFIHSVDRSSMCVRLFVRSLIQQMSLPMVRCGHV